MRLKAVAIVAGAAAVLLTGLAVPTQAQAHPARGFVTRSGSQLRLDGQPFRFSGANVEWLGLVGYGPLNTEAGQFERFPTHFEIDDALATAKEMGSTVIRAQTLGDTVGCGNCLEPTLGHFNAQAFRVMDYAIARARDYGIKLIPEFDGDARAEQGSTDSIYSAWHGGASFWTDPTVIGDFENHVAHIVNHVNSYTGIAYKDDPTILGWLDCNVCGSLDGTVTATQVTNWVSTISGFVKSIDPRHLFISNTAPLTADAPQLAIPTVDAYSTEIYPHWYQYYGGLTRDQVAALPHQSAALTVAAGKVFFMSEFGWDRTNFATAADLQTYLDGLKADHNISGDLFWALEAHTDGHGWKPIPNNLQCQPSCDTNEDGSWWAFYYTGIATASHTAADMLARGQILRTHAYGMRGIRVPRHDIPPAPSNPQISNGRLYWQGSAGAVNYSIQRSTGWGHWTTVCSHCATDQSNGWPTTTRGFYRVIPYNLDGRPGPASTPALNWRRS